MNRRAFVCAIMLAGTGLGWGRPAFSQQMQSGTIVSDAADQLLGLTNQVRAQSGSKRLEWDQGLAQAAQAHCLRMAAEGPIAHRYGGEADLSTRAAQAGARFDLIEENVAVGPSAEVVHDQWMHSPGHRSNLMNPEVDRVGIAVVAARGVLYATADYARGVQPLSPDQVEAKVADLIRVSGVALLGDHALARAACAMDRGLPGIKDEVRPGFIMRWQDSELNQLPRQLADNLISGQYHKAAVGSCPAQGVEGDFTAYRVAVLLY